MILAQLGKMGIVLSCCNTTYSSGYGPYYIFITYEGIRVYRSHKDTGEFFSTLNPSSLTGNSNDSAYPFDDDTVNKCVQFVEHENRIIGFEGDVLMTQTKDKIHIYLNVN